MSGRFWSFWSSSISPIAGQLLYIFYYVVFFLRIVFQYDITKGIYLRITEDTLIEDLLTHPALQDPEEPDNFIFNIEWVYAVLDAFENTKRDILASQAAEGGLNIV